MMSSRRRPSRRRSASPVGIRHLPAAWIAIATRAFQALEVSASIADLGPSTGWYPIHLAHRELGQFGRHREREEYNRHWLARARREHRTFVSELGGFNDVFAPVVVGGRVVAAVVVGPILARPASAASIIDQWQAITGHAPASDDLAFRHYLDSVLGAAVVSGTSFDALVELVRVFARLLAGTEPVPRAAQRIDRLLHRAWQSSAGQRMGRAVSSMLDERSAASWRGAHRHYDLMEIGLDAVPSDIAVVFAFAAEPRTGAPIEQLFDRLAWQRSCADLAISTRGAASGTIGDYGVVLLSRARGTPSTRRQALLDLAQRARDLAMRKHRLSAHAAIGPLGDLHTLPARFERSLAVAQAAMYRGTPLLDADAFHDDAPGDRVAGGHELIELARLARSVLDGCAVHPALIEPVLDRYLAAVALRSAYRPAVARAHLDDLAGRVADDLLASGALELALANALLADLRPTTTSSASLPELLAHYRRTLLALARAAQRPAQADQELKIRRASAFIAANYTSALRLADAARVAGLAPAHFSRTFKLRRGQTFEQYLLELRIERAKELLRNTRISVARVAEQSGFGSPVYFHRAFRRMAGMTPAGFRDAALHGST